ncbi:MAG: hypothetical protein ACR2P7_02640 [bacterium]
MSEVCFENENHGALVNYYLYKKDAAEYTPRHSIWEYKRETRAEPRRCVSVHDLPIKIGDRLIAGYQVEGKRIGKHTFACPRDIVTQSSKLERALFRITGATIWNTNCNRSRQRTGEFLHNDKDVVAASEICFDNDNHGVLLDYILVKDRGNAVVWRSAYQQALMPMRCTRLKTLPNLNNGEKLKPAFKIQSIADTVIELCPSAPITVDHNSKNKALLRTIGWTASDVECVRTNHISSANAK